MFLDGRVGWVAFALLVAGCGGDGGRGKGTLQVVATTGMVADMVRHVGGSHVTVSTLMKAGVDPHLYKPVTDDIDRLAEADVIFYSGRNLEGKMGEVFARMARLKPTLGIADAVPDSELLPGEGGHHDPHLWFNVRLWSLTLEPIAEVLAKRDPAHADEYRANAATHRDKLMELHAEVARIIADLPEDKRELVTAHDAFRYFGTAYGFRVHGIQGISTESEAGLGSVNKLVAFLKDKRIKAVFVESSVSPKNVEALIEGCAQPPNALKLRIGGELFSDAMGEEGTREGTYEGMVLHNVRTIVEALK